MLNAIEFPDHLLSALACRDQYVHQVDWRMMWQTPRQLLPQKNNLCEKVL